MDLAAKVVTVIGDSMIDHYTIGEVNRISPEGPFPVFESRQQFNMNGGAASVVENLLSAGVGTVNLITKISPKDRNRLNFNERKERVNLYGQHTEGGNLCVKIRYVADNQILFRADKDTVNLMDTSNLEASMHEVIDSDLFVLVDYAKGVFHKDSLDILATWLWQKPVILAPKRSFSWFEKIEPEYTICNKGEFKHVSAYQNKTTVIQTAGPAGCWLWPEGEQLRTAGVRPVCVIGAGDVFLAYYAAGELLGEGTPVCAGLANLAATHSVTTDGTGRVDVTELQQFVEQLEAINFTMAFGESQSGIYERVFRLLSPGTPASPQDGA